MIFGFLTVGLTYISLSYPAYWMNVVRIWNFSVFHFICRSINGNSGSGFGIHAVLLLKFRIQLLVNNGHPLLYASSSDVPSKFICLRRIFTASCHIRCSAAPAKYHSAVRKLHVIADRFVICLRHPEYRRCIIPCHSKKYRLFMHPGQFRGKGNPFPFLPPGEGEFGRSPSLKFRPGDARAAGMPFSKGGPKSGPGLQISCLELRMPSFRVKMGGCFVSEDGRSKTE